MNNMLFKKEALIKRFMNLNIIKMEFKIAH